MRLVIGNVLRNARSAIIQDGAARVDPARETVDRLQKVPASQNFHAPPASAYSRAMRLSPACASTAVNRSPVQEDCAVPGFGIFLDVAQSIAAWGNCVVPAILLPLTTR